MLGMKNHFDISGSIEMREVDIAGVAYISQKLFKVFPQGNVGNYNTHWKDT